jgi:hypothetical protein
VDWIQELRRRLAAPLRELATEVASEFPGVRVIEHSFGRTQSSECQVGLSCILAAVSKAQPDLIDLTISATDLATAPVIASADVCWGHPSGKVELELFDRPVLLNEDSLCMLEEQLPNLAGALRNALRRGRPT